MMQTTIHTKQRTVLCVDDDDDDRELINDVIKEVDKSCLVLNATSGEEALRMLSKEETRPNLILLDINMPGMGGKETLKKIKASETLSTIPVIVFTTSTNPADAAFFSDFGVSVRTKPDRFQTMVKTVEQFLAELS